MTTINLHGLLAQEYQKQFVLKVDSVKDIVRAIDANRKGFRKRVNDLQREGLPYDIIVNGGASESGGSTTKNIKQVDLVPVIAGAFGIGAAILGAIGITGAAATVVTAVAVGAGAAMLAKALKPKPEKQPDVGGTVATNTSAPAQDEPVTFQSRGASASMMFNNNANLASQGAPVPIGYGRLKVGSSVIQGTIKSFPMSAKTALAFIQNPFHAFGDTEYTTDFQEIYTSK